MLGLSKMRKRSGKKNKNGAAMKKEDGCHKNKKNGTANKKGKKSPKTRWKKKASKQEKQGDQGAKREPEEGSSVTKKVFEMIDGTQERELYSQLSFCILKKKIFVGPAMKVLD